MMRKIASMFICLVAFFPYIPAISQSLIWVETELFQNKGGWITDSQFIDQMGSPYLLAHGLSKPCQRRDCGKV